MYEQKTFYCTPLHYAVELNKIEYVKLLLLKPDIDVNLYTILNFLI